METIHFITFLVALASSILSGIAGGGGSFIVAPFWLLAGLTPAQGAATGAFMALGMSGGSLAAFRGKGFMTQNHRVVTALLCTTLVASFVGPFILNKIDPSAFAPILAVLTVLSVPLLFLKKRAAATGRAHMIIGFGGVSLLLVASSFVVSSAFSILMSIVMVHMFHFGVLEGTAIKRLMGIVQSGVIVIILTLLGHFVWAHALAGIFGGVIGSFLGTKISLKCGERFARWMLAAGGVLSALLLLLG